MSLVYALSLLRMPIPVQLTRGFVGSPVTVAKVSPDLSRRTNEDAVEPLAERKKYRRIRDSFNSNRVIYNAR